MRGNSYISACRGGLSLSMDDNAKSSMLKPTLTKTESLLVNEANVKVGVRSLVKLSQSAIPESEELFNTIVGGEDQPGPQQFELMNWILFYYYQLHLQ